MDFVVISYEVVNAQTHKHDLYKIIQSKRPFLYSIYHGFSWSGSKQPRISSELQEIGELKKGTKGDPFDRVELILKKPLLYNETTTAHFHADMDDTDGKAEPFLNFAVNVPMTMISYKVILRDKPEGFSDKAIVEKIPTREGSIRAHELVDEVCFDSETKSYSYSLPYPEPGYSYKLSWKKD